MVDHNQSKNQTKSEGEDNVVELSAEMALKDQAKHKIIDLTEDIDSPVDQDKAEAPPSPEPPAPDITDLLLEDDIINQGVEETILEEVAFDDFPAAEDPTYNHQFIEEPTETIEDEVDLAFDVFSEEPEVPTNAEVDDLLFDELTDIPQQVDTAVGDTAPPPETDELLSASTPAPLDEDDLSTQAAELEAALSGEMDMAPMDPADDPGDDTGALVDGETGDSENDDIIELLDVVDPSELEAELEAIEQKAKDDNEIIELTQVVAPDELEDTDDKQPPEEGPSETAARPVPSELPAAEEIEPKELEEELSLAGLDDIEMNSEEVDALSTDENAFEPAELENLFGEEDTSEGRTSEGEDLELPADDIHIESIPDLEDSDGLFDIVDELNDVQLPDETQLEAVDLPLEEEAPVAAAEEESPSEDQVIQLADILSSTKDKAPTAELSETLPDENPEDDAAEPDTHEAARALAVDIVDDVAGEAPQLEDKKIEAAVEHIIKTKYADKIEQLIANAVEEAVTREIANIKRTLSDMDEPPA